MARTKEFDPDAVLHRAMELFWRRGYDGTSMADLVEHLGIGRASLYATFGGKRELYEKALDRYLRMRDPDPVAVLSAPGPALPAVRALVERYVEEASRGLLGCMVVNTAVELMGADPGLARRVESSWRDLEDALAGAFARAQAGGELPGDRDPRALAALVLVFLQGLQVMGRAESPDTARLRAAAAQLDALLA
ncbi:TetR/AcrR family transcriptional regulator [Bailinhaonella thermotolerans]|uniref:TetR family transcriptional regulator n=1 Tax=Bailinhaonella thermotolerans TaxID=1070861 RepID=A0A3A4BFL2_9ACTN|nr:TetR/AcrR family transcriptional regulator [Bailinhaonella thermotolerans]RJL30132.1 TetR family transcriptional regulator [Bailinhaonella thermotolerans]